MFRFSSSMIAVLRSASSWRSCSASSIAAVSRPISVFAAASSALSRSACSRADVITSSRSLNMVSTLSICLDWSATSSNALSSLAAQHGVFLIKRRVGFLAFGGLGRVLGRCFLQFGESRVEAFDLGIGNLQLGRLPLLQIVKVGDLRAAQRQFALLVGGLFLKRTRARLLPAVRVSAEAGYQWRRFRCGRRNGGRVDQAAAAQSPKPPRQAPNKIFIDIDAETVPRGRRLAPAGQVSACRRKFFLDISICSRRGDAANAAATESPD